MGMPGACHWFGCWGVRARTAVSYTVTFCTGKPPNGWTCCGVPGGSGATATATAIFRAEGPSGAEGMGGPSGAEGIHAGPPNGAEGIVAIALVAACASGAGHGEVAGE